MTTKFWIEADREMTLKISKNLLHPRLEVELLGLTPGPYEMDVVKVPINTSKDGVYIKKTGTKIIRLGLPPS